MRKSRLSSKLAMEIEAAFELVFQESGRTLALRDALAPAMALVGETCEQLPQRMEDSLVVRRAYDRAAATCEKIRGILNAPRTAPTPASTVVPAMVVNRYGNTNNPTPPASEAYAYPSTPRKPHIVLTQEERIYLTRRFNQLIMEQPTRDKGWTAHQAQEVLDVARRRDPDKRHSVLKCVYTSANPWEFSLANKPESFLPAAAAAVVATAEEQAWIPPTPPPVAMPPVACEVRPQVEAAVKPSVLSATAAQAGAILNILSGRSSRDYANQLFNSLNRIESALNDIGPMMDLIENVNRRLLRLRRDHRDLTERLDSFIARKEPIENIKAASIRSR